MSLDHNMSKPVVTVTILAAKGKSAVLPAVFDTGSFFTIVRRDCLPAGTAVRPLASPLRLRAATKGSRLKVAGTAELVIQVGRKRIMDDALVSPNLAPKMLIGAKTMQAWDISIRNRNGSTRIVLGRDLRDPEITEVD
jgi:hypothetical protein